MIKLKDLLPRRLVEGLEDEPPKSVWAPGTGVGQSHTYWHGLLGTPSNKKKIGGSPEKTGRVSTEYTLSDEEEEFLRNKTRSERVAYLKNKLYLLRKSRGKCVRDCEEPVAPGLDKNGKKHVYCQKHTDQITSYLKYKRDKNRAAKIGWDIEEDMMYDPRKDPREIGINAIIHLQSLIGIDEPYKRAAKTWDSMNREEKLTIMKTYKILSKCKPSK